MSKKYPTTLSIDYPNRELDRVSTFFRFIVAIPILIVLSSVSGASSTDKNSEMAVFFGAGGLLFFGPLLMILFRQKYPRWWFDWNLELMRFNVRVVAFMALMNDKYPSTDDHQTVHLDIKYPNVTKELNQWLPLIKWILAIPHYFVLIFLDIAAVLSVIYSWLSIILTGRYPKSAFEFVEKVMRWNVRVASYAFVLATDEYPPFSLD